MSTLPEFICLLWCGVWTRLYHTVKPCTYSCGLPFLSSSSERRTPTKCDRYCSVGHILFFFFRSSDDQLLRLSSVDLVPRLGLNSIHSTIMRSHLLRRSSLSAYPAIRSTRRLSRLQRHVVVACLLTLATGAGVGGRAPKNLFQVFSACRALPFWRAVWRHAAFLGMG